MKGNNLRPIQYGKFTAEECQIVNVNELIRKVKNLLKEELLKIELKGLGDDIKLTSSKTGNGGRRCWFFCPKCNRRVGTLYRPPGRNTFLCRHCYKLEYLLGKYHRSSQEEHAKLIKKLLKMRGKGLI